MVPWDIARGQPFQGRAGGKPLFHMLAGLPPCRRRTRQAVSLQEGWSLEVSVRQPAISSLLSILPKMPGMDSRSTGSGASMGTVSRSSSPT